ncbi:MAG: LCP family protein [Patescibacteria group bacterium]|jgi:hypothetical protein
MKRFVLFYFIPSIFITLVLWLAINGIYQYQDRAEERKVITEAKAAQKAQDEALENLLDSRRTEAEKTEETDMFGADGIVKILFIGVDKRAGQTAGHCDAIQLITIDQKKSTVMITAVPRGTYSPLPPGMGATSSDYYVSNACGLGGLDYGVKQIEKILGQKADYLVVVGFSEVLGILRNLKLPTTDTLRWLRHRQGYAIGEPQRAHNHSTFLKQLLTQFVPEKNSQLDKIWQYFIYKLVETDLSFAQTQSLVISLSAMDLKNHSERIALTMRPAYSVQDIPYSAEYLGEYLNKMINPIKDRLNPKDYSGEEDVDVEAELLKLVSEKNNDPEFVSWAFENNLWQQFENKEKRLSVQYDFMKRYSLSIANTTDRETVVADYILEMKHSGENVWAEKGEELLISEIFQ